MATPSFLQSGHWVYGQNPDQNLLKWSGYLEHHMEHLLDIDQMIEDFQNGLYFESSIPVGYGLGSSGALTAAVYHRYAKEKSMDLKILHNVLGRMEGFFHGKSSGIDPLVSFLQQPILKTAEGLQMVDSRRSFEGFHLLDSGMERSTSKLVNQFNNKLQDEGSKRYFKNEWLPLANEGIEMVLVGDEEGISRKMYQIQQLIWEHFREFIPLAHVELWESTLNDFEVSIKLCGAGGGGMSLVYGAVPNSWGAMAMI